MVGCVVGGCLSPVDQVPYLLINWRLSTWRPAYVLFLTFLLVTDEVLAAPAAPGLGVELVINR